MLLIDKQTDKNAILDCRLAKICHPLWCDHWCNQCEKTFCLTICIWSFHIWCQIQAMLNIYLKVLKIEMKFWCLDKLFVIFSCDQAALWMVQSVRPSVCPSVCPSVTPFWLCSHHRIIMKFSGVITSDKSDVHAIGQGQRSKVKVTEVMTPFSRFRTVTPD